MIIKFYIVLTKTAHKTALQISTNIFNTLLINERKQK